MIFKKRLRESWFIRKTQKFLDSAFSSQDVDGKNNFKVKPCFYLYDNMAFTKKDNLILCSEVSRGNLPSLWS